jgi:hypothetical protein
VTRGESKEYCYAGQVAMLPHTNPISRGSKPTSCGRRLRPDLWDTDRLTPDAFCSVRDTEPSRARGPQYAQDFPAQCFRIGGSFHEPVMFHVKHHWIGEGQVLAVRSASDGAGSGTS